MFFRFIFSSPTAIFAFLTTFLPNIVFLNRKVTGLDYYI